MPVSLFYQYVDIRDPVILAQKLRPLGEKLRLAGRIRVSTEGINGTFGGDEAAVKECHQIICDLLKESCLDSSQLCDATDFKVSNGGAENFPEGWRVRICKELVTMGELVDKVSWRKASPHLTPDKFREEILKGKVVVLDVRNQYEHAIGRFRGAVLPPIRQFSDFPRYIRENKELFRDRRVLMYCTGGIRCERASAYMEKVGVASSIAQLKGGIDRFLNMYPSGGDLFEGKNLVFDTRMALPTKDPVVVGRCYACDAPWDDYSGGWRCSYCRSRVLLCDKEQCRDVFHSRKKSLCLSCTEAGRIQVSVTESIDSKMNV